MTIRQVLGGIAGLAVLSAVISGCVPGTPTAAPAPAALPDAPLSAPSPSATPPPAPQNSAPDQFLFVEVREERVYKSDAAGQTTSFAGEGGTYSYDPAAGRLSGPLEGVLAGETAVVVGYVVITQIDRNRAASGQLYVLPEEGRTFGLILVEGAGPDGSVRFTYAGEVYVLEPGESVRLEVEAEASGEGLPAGQTQHDVTVTNHGLLPTEGLTAVAP